MLTDIDITRLAANLEAQMRRVGRIFIFGPGRNGRMVQQNLTARGVRVAAFLADIDAPQVEADSGLPILPFAAADADIQDALVIVSMFSARHSFAATAARIEARGGTAIPIHQICAWIGDKELPFYFAGRRTTGDMAPGSLDALMIDTAAKERLRQHLRFSIELDPRHALAPESGYFSAVSARGAMPATYVDGGAFDGDTVREYLRSVNDRFDRILAFEPDPGNYAALSRHLEVLPPAIRLKITTECAALWSAPGEGRIELHGNAMSKVGETGEACRFVALDDILSADRASLVKLDLEGAEADAIQGMRQILSAGKAYLMAAIYHTPDQLWQVAAAIHRLNDRYRFDLHAHAYDGADVMLHAIPPR